MKKIAKGFTLVELMIVVAIIGILAAIAIPNFMKYQLRAKYGELPTNINGWFKAEESLRQAERTIPAPNGDGTTTGQYWVPAAALPTGCLITVTPTTKKKWVGADLAKANAIDWVVEGSTYACYQGGTAGGVAGGTGVYGTSLTLEASADIDGDTIGVATVLFKPVLDAAGLVTGTPPASAATIPFPVAGPWSTVLRYSIASKALNDNVF